MKTEETVWLEHQIRNTTQKMGVFQCFEVTIGFCGHERVDFMTYDTDGIFRCYEIKVSKSDFHSNAAVSFVGHYNYYVLTRDLYEQVKDEIPDWVGVYVDGCYCAKKAKKQDISNKVYKTRRTIDGRSTEITIPWIDLLKDSMLRSLYRDSTKLFYSENKDVIEKLENKLEQAIKERDNANSKYRLLTIAIQKRFGVKARKKLVDDVLCGRIRKK